MRRVKLYTSDGGFVVAGVIPPFLPGLEAEVVIWGVRVFKLVRSPSGEPAVDFEQSFAYHEVFYTALVSTE